MKLTFICLIGMLFTSCEVYERYFVMASNRYGEAGITVKVNAVYDLPKGFITAGKSKIGCNADIDLQDGNFTEKIPILKDTIKLQYSFTLPPCYTVLLQPTNIGPSDIEYVIINGQDTVATNWVNHVKFNSVYSFKKHSKQRFLLTIKAP
jgi:hypothetical protein